MMLKSFKLFNFMIMNNFVGIFCYENFTCGTGNDEDKNQKLKNSRQKRC